MDKRSMVLKGCLRCYMYVMLMPDKLKCPRCMTTKLLDIPKPKVPKMVVMGCQRCYMYVMVSEDNLKCPKCKEGDLLAIPKPKIPDDDEKKKAA